MTKHLIIAGGGTGGHIFPGIAIAEEWTRQGGKVTFVGTSQGQEKDIVPKYDFPLRLLEVGRLKGAGMKQKLKTVAGLPGAILKARKLIKEVKGDVVLGIGGYASGPVALAAKQMGVKTAITDQNVQPGLTNRVLGKIVDRVFLSFTESEHFFPRRKIVLAGNPIRSQISHKPYQLPGEKFRLFIFGGSQGAQAVNQRVLEALTELKDLWPKLAVVHQAGKGDVAEVRKFYEQNQLSADVRTFFDNMNEQYQNAQLIVCRAGAGTLTEIALSGRPAVLVPYPFAADDHQTKNAEVFANANAAWLMPQKDLSGKKLAQLIRDVYLNPKILAERAENARRLAKPDAAKTIVGELQKLAS